MFIHPLVGTENHPVYQQLSAENLERQYTFLQSVITASLALGQPSLSIEIIKALNHHAIACLHPSAGEFRPWPVEVGEYRPPLHFEVPALMQMFTNHVNRIWDASDPVALAAYVLWKMNHIHPFINGNGRAARAACYLVLCTKLGGWLPGETILPELIRANRPEYVGALKAADEGLRVAGQPDLTILHAFLARLLAQQLAGPAGPPAPEPVTS